MSAGDSAAPLGDVTFRDLFSSRSSLYAACRPRYPTALFSYLATVAPRRGTAWDCATGTGQAATGLVGHFERVIATDASARQIAGAEKQPSLSYAMAAAEQSPLRSGCADIVTVAQALHWFDVPVFFREARRALASDGVIAIWGYGDPIMNTPELHEILYGFNRGTLERYWMPERMILLDGYRDVSFPFEEIKPPEFELEVQWTLGQLAGYLRTWSAAVRYEEANGVDPVAEVEATLAESWGERDTPRAVRWPLYLRVGTK